MYRTFSIGTAHRIRQLVRSAGFTETYSANGRSLTTISIAPAGLKATDGELTIVSTGNQRHVIAQESGRCPR